jgi:disulfide bond formation protein DsbB/mono/diheme cytochrome c family protein
MNGLGLGSLFSRSSLSIALLTAWVAMLGSLYFSNVLGYLPCDLCWYQRILMYPLAGILAIGMLRRDENLPYYILPFSLAGQGLSTYHYLLEKTQIFGAPTACLSGVPCTVAWINWYGFITIPFLAMSAFFIITVMSLIAITAGEPRYDERRGMPWFRVVAIIGLVALTFGAMTEQNRSTSTPLSLLERPGGEQTTVTAAAIAVDFSGGAKLYAEACAVCHGADARGVANLGNSLVDSPVITEYSDADALAFIRAGVDLSDPRNTTGQVMPASGGRPDLDDNELRAILDYLRNR